MSKKFIVRAPDRKASGHPGQYRGGRFFPGGEDRTIEVLDQEECPMVVERDGNKERTFLDPERVGLKAWRLIEADLTLSKRPFGTPLLGQDAPGTDAARTKIVHLEADVKAKATRIRELEEQGMNLQAILEEVGTNSKAELKAAAEEVQTLRAKVAELEEELAGLREEADYASSMTEKNVALETKVAELTATLESLTAPTTKIEEPKTPKSKAVK